MRRPALLLVLLVFASACSSPPAPGPAPARTIPVLTDSTGRIVVARGSFSGREWVAFIEGSPEGWEVGNLRGAAASTQLESLRSPAGFLHASDITPGNVEVVVGAVWPESVVTVRAESTYGPTIGADFYETTSDLAPFRVFVLKLSAAATESSPLHLLALDQAGKIVARSGLSQP